MTDSLRLLHSSDWHIGMTRRHLPESKQAVFRDARLSAVERLCEHAVNYDVAAVVVAGDIFDGTQLDSNTIVSLLEMLGDLPCPVVLQPGNHDSYQRESVYCAPAFRTHCPDNVIVPTEPTVLVLPEISQLELIVGPYTNRYPTENPFFTALQSIENHPKDSDTYRVGIVHGSVDTFAPQLDDAIGGDVIPLEKLENALSQYDCDYIALGDRHSTATVGKSGRIWYSGSPEMTDFDDVEKDSRHCLLVELAADDCTVTPLDCGKWTFHTVQKDINSVADITELAHYFDTLPNKRRTVIRLACNATLPLDDAAYLAEEEDRWESMLAGFHVWERNSSTHVLPATDEVRKNLAGYVAEAADELAQQAEAGDETAQNALMLLYRLAAQGGYH